MKENSWKVSDTEQADYGIELGHPGHGQAIAVGGGGLIGHKTFKEDYIAKQLPKEDIFMPKYKFNEDKLLAQFRQYVDKTYTQHYAQNKFQATEFIIDSGHGMGFALGNVMKYAQRYGKKDGYNRQDLMKVLHYALIALHVHDATQPKKESN